MRMKGMLKKTLSLVLVFVMAAGMTACGGGGDSEVNAAAKEHVFRSEDVNLDVDISLTQEIRSVCKVEERLYMYTVSYTENGLESYLLSTAMDGSDVKVIPVESLNIERTYNDPVIDYPVAMPEARDDVPETEAAEDETGEEPVEDTELPADTDGDIPADDSEKYLGDMGMVSRDGYVSNMVSDGKLLYLLYDEYYNDYRDQNNPVYEENYYLVAVDTEGNELWRQSLGRNGSDSMGYVYVSSIMGTEDGVLCNIQNDNGSSYALYGDDGTKKEEFTLDIQESGNLYLNGKGDLYLQYWGEVDGNYQQKIQKLDIGTKTLSEPLNIPGMSSYSLNVCRNVYGGDYDLYVYDTIAVYGYNEGDQDKTEILNFIDSDIDSSYMNQLVIVNDTQMLMMGMDYTANDYMGAFVFSRLSKVDPADVKDKVVLKLACYGNLYEVRSKVIDFNKTNEEYRIQITDYSSYSEDGDWNAGITRLNSDIVSGNVPDILYLNSSMPVSSYISKGLFADLYPFIDKDPDMNREDFFSNILEAFSVDGKLYQLVPSFNVMTVVGKSRYVGEKMGWTVDDMIALVDSMPEDMDIFDDIVRTDFLYMVLNQSGTQFMDWKTGECHFDSDEFVKLLEFCRRFPAEYDSSRYEDENFWMTYDSRFREDRTLLSTLYLNYFRQYQRMKYGSFGEDITMVGFPCQEGNGASISYDTAIAMSAKSKNQDGAWSFMRQYLLEDYQSQISYGWPLSLSRVETLKQEAMQRPYWLDENGEKVEYDDTYWINEQDIVIPPMNQEEVDTVMELLTSVTQLSTYDENLNNIVYEEAEAYFSGQKSAQEVASIIQSRASIYVSENR